MSFRMQRVGREADPILVHLFQYYLHDMSEWFGFEIGSDGCYAYDTAVHWERNEAVYLANVGSALAGFAIVGSSEQWTADPQGLDVREFFVLRNHRRSGVAQAMAHSIWEQHRGRWLVRVLEANLPAAAFWKKTVAGRAGAFDEQRFVGADGRPRLFFSFAN